MHPTPGKLRILAFGALLLLMLAAFSVPAQEGTDKEDAGWAYGQFPYETEKARDKINEIVNAGLVPVGLSVQEGTALHVLFARLPGTDISQWSIHMFDDPDTLESEMTKIIQRGWEPTGMSRRANAIYGLFVHTGGTIEGWRLHKVPADSTHAEKAIQDFRERGFLVRDVSFFQDSAWFVFVDAGRDVSELDVALKTYPPNQDALQPAVTQQMEEGWAPSGVTLHGKELTILFTR
jgi:hypothetical protein